MKERRTLTFGLPDLHDFVFHALLITDEVNVHSVSMSWDKFDFSFDRRRPFTVSVSTAFKGDGIDYKGSIDLDIRRTRRFSEPEMRMLVKAIGPVKAENLPPKPPASDTGGVVRRGA